MAALGATFAGFLSHYRNPDILTTALAAGITFAGTAAALYVLHLAFRMTVVAFKVAVPVGVLLAIGCANDWPWAESAVDWLRWVGGKGMAVADQQLHEWQTSNR